MKRMYCNWKPNHGCESPSHIVGIGVSCEGKSILRAKSIHAFAARRKGAKWYGYTEKAFQSGKLLWAWIRERCRAKEPISLFCTNWHEAAQVTGFWNEIDYGRFAIGLPSRDYLLSTGVVKRVRAWAGICAIDTKPFIVFATTRSGSVKLCCTTNYYDVAECSLAKSFGIDQPTFPAECSKENRHEIVAEWKSRIAFESMRRTIHVWRESNRGNWQPTAARLAMSNYRHEFMKDHGMTKDDPRMDREFHREACFGGEIGCWFLGEMEGPIHKFDINSLYPKVMYEGRFPRAIKFHCPPDSIVGRTRPAFPAECVARVRLECDGRYPIRRRDGSVEYPTGEKQTTLAGQELGRADSEGRIRQWYGWTWFDCAPVFQRYVEYWWTVRRQAQIVGDKAGERLAKIMLNSLYGKFGARRSRWLNQVGMESPIQWGHYVGPDKDRLDADTGFPLPGKFRAVGGLVQKMSGREERNDTFPAVTAFVTAAARVYMQNIRQSLPVQSVLAQNNDCFIVTEAGALAIWESEFWGETELGKFKLEKSYDRVNIWGGGRYEGDNEVKVAGLPTGWVRESTNRFVCSVPEYTGTMVAGGTARDGVVIGKRDYLLVKQTRGNKFGEDGWRVK